MASLYYKNKDGKMTKLPQHTMISDAKIRGQVDAFMEENLNTEISNGVANFVKNDTTLVKSSEFDKKLNAYLAENPISIDEYVSESWSVEGAEHTSNTATSKPLTIEKAIENDGTISKLHIGAVGDGTVTLTVFSTTKAFANYVAVTKKYEETFNVVDGENDIECSIAVEKGQFIALLATDTKLKYLNHDNGIAPVWAINYSDYYYLMSGATTARSYDFSYDFAVPTPIVEYVKNLDIPEYGKQWRGKKVLTIGDSITQGNTWQPTLKTLLGASEMWNRGVANSTLASFTVDEGTTLPQMAIYTDTSTYTEDVNSVVYQSPYTGDGTDLPTGVEAQNYWMHGDNRFATYPTTQQDLVIIMCGTNDFYRSIDVGEMKYTAYWNSQEIYNKATVCGALCELIRRLNVLYNYKAKIVVVGMPWNNGIQDADSGTRFFDTLDGIKSTARQMGVHYIDLVSALGWNNQNLKSKCSDGVHPTDETVGAEIARAIYQELCNIYPL